MKIARKINRKFTKWRLENTITRKERLKCKKDAKRMINKIKKRRNILKSMKNKKAKKYGLISEINCKAIIKLANRGNKERRNASGR